jgi:glycosyltransferase involved in cell wall biosynthesis
MVMPPRPHVLFISHCLPHPPDSGATARTLNILRQLQKQFDITLVAFSRRNHQPDADARQASRRALEQFLASVSEPVPVPAEHSILRLLRNHLKSLASGRAYTFYEYWSRDFQVQLRGAIARRSPDLIHIDSLDLYRWVQELPQITKVCTHHNIESELLYRRAEKVKSTFVRKYIFHQAHLVERIEREFCPQFNVNLMMSELDAKKLRNIAPGSRTVVVPNGVDTEYFTPTLMSPPVPGRIIFVGSPDFQNRDAVEYLLRDIWSNVRAGDQSASLKLIGRSSESDRARYEIHTGVTCLGYVADVRPHMAQGSCCVVPIRVGGGTRLKILDAWAMGKPVVSTSIGCEGLEAIDGENILIRDAPKAFAEAVLEVLSDPELRSRLGKSGRKMAERTYSWDVVGQGLRAYYWSLLRTTSHPLICNH